MAVSVLSAAKTLAIYSNWSLSNLKLQKILYIAHMFYLGRTDGDPLVNGLFEAWSLGPVHPILYHEAKVFGANPVRDYLHEYEIAKEGDERDMIHEAYDRLREFTPGQLVNATHRKDGAWDRNYKPNVRGVAIPNKHILDEYRRFILKK